MKKVTKDKFGFTLLLFNIILFALSISYFSYSLFLLQKIERQPMIIPIIVQV